MREPRHQGFSLAELLLVIAVIGLVSAIAVPTIGNLRKSAQMVKLENDVAVANSAVKHFMANGGSIQTGESASDILRKISIPLDETERATFVGFTGGMIDARVVGQPLSSSEINRDVPRIVWSHVQDRFIITKQKVAGIGSIEISTEEEAEPEVAAASYDDEDGFEAYSKSYRASSAVEKQSSGRRSSMRYASKSDWIWDFEEKAKTPRSGPTSVVKTSLPNTTALPTPVAPPPAGPVKLDAPLFSIPGGNYSVSQFSLSVELTDPNPSGAGQIYYQLGGGDSWTAYTPGEGLTVEPGARIAAYVLPNPSTGNKYEMSDLSQSQYLGDPIQLQLKVASTSRNVRYFDIVDDNFAVDLSVSNIDLFPDFIKADSFFSTYWAPNPLNPRNANQGILAGAYDVGYSGHKIGLNPDLWDGESSLTLRAYAKSENEEWVLSSGNRSIALNAIQEQLPPPRIDLQDQGDGTFLVTMTESGRLPDGSGFYYNETGGSPVQGADGSVSNGSLYSGPFIWKPEEEENGTPASTGNLDIGIGQNDVPISQVVLKSTGKKITQESSYDFEKLDNPGFDGGRGAQVVDSSSDRITLESITINAYGKEIVADNVNVLDVTVSNLNYPDTIEAGDVKVLQGGQVKDDLTGYTSSGDNRNLIKSLENNLRSTNLRDYIDYSGGGKYRLQATDHDFDVAFAPLRNSDFLVVMERYGNSTFDLRPLDAAGQVIAGSNRLTFKEYSWNTGHAPSDTGGQPFFFSVIRIEKFGVDTAQDSIAGFRVNNDGGADFKFFTISDESFEEREVNYSGVFRAITAPPSNLLNWFSASDPVSQEVAGSTGGD